MIDYKAASATYDNTRRASDLVVESLAARGLLAEGRRVLDFGCGTGNYLKLLSSRFGCELCGLEPCAEMRDLARAKNPGMRIEAGDHATIPFAPGYFDLVYMTDVIHHVSDLDLLFESLAQVLVPRGMVCVATESHAQVRARWYNAFFPSLAEVETARYPDISEIAQRASMAGFRLASVEILESPGPKLIDEAFLRLVREKGYSMFRLIGEAEREAGLHAMEEAFRADPGRSYDSPQAGESLVWLEKGEA